MTPAERAAIGAALVAPDKAVEVRLSAEDFSDGMAASVWQAVVNRASAGEGVDVVTLLSDLGDSYRELVGGVMAEQFSASNLGSYAKQVRKDAKGRRLKALLSGLNTRDPDKAIEQAMAGLIELGRSRDVKSYTMRELMAAMSEEISRIEVAHEVGDSVGVPTGMARVDKLLGGLHRSDLVIVAARPAMGKTAWMMSAALNAARRGYHGGIVSAEMAALQLAERSVAAGANVSTYKLRNGGLRDADYSAITRVMAELAEVPLSIMDPDTCTPGDVLTQAHVWAAGRLDFLMVDFLQLLKPEQRADMRSREVGDTARALKSVAKALDIPVVALCQLNRGLESRQNKRPMLSDMRDSGEIEEAADEVLFLYRDCVYNDVPDHEAELIVAKNRHGPTGHIDLHFDAQRMTWLDPDMRDYEATA